MKALRPGMFLRYVRIHGPRDPGRARSRSVSPARLEWVGVHCGPPAEVFEEWDDCRSEFRDPAAASLQTYLQVVRDFQATLLQCESELDGLIRKPALDPLEDGFDDRLRELPETADLLRPIIDRMPASQRDSSSGPSNNAPAMKLPHWYSTVWQTTLSQPMIFDITRART